MSDKPGVIEEMKEAVSDQEHSIDEKAPGTPFALVALSYLAVLALASGAVGLVLWMTARS